LAAGVLAVVRIWLNVKKSRAAHDRGDFDERLVARLRAEGSDPFKPHDIDFFLAFGDPATASSVCAELRARGFAVDLQTTADASDFPHTVHVTRSLPLAVSEIKPICNDLDALARARGGRFDGWTAAHVARTDSGGVSFREPKP
jgi:hypothetical protein